VAEKQFGVGVAGISWVSHEHIKAFEKNPHTHVVALQSASMDNANAARERHGLDDAKTYTSYEQMLSDPRVEVVTICSTNEKHARQAIQAAQAGKHVLIEKPIALTLEELRELKQTITSAGVKSVTSFVLHWNPYFESIKKFIEAGAMGRPFYGEVDYFSGNWQKWYAGLSWVRTRAQGGSALLAAGCHAMDGLRYFMPGEIKEVYALAGNFTGLMEWDATICTMLSFADGRIGKVACVLEGNNKYWYNVRLHGPDGTVVNEKFRTAYLPGTTTWAQFDTVMPDSPDVSHHPFQGEIDHLMDGIVNNTPISPDIDDAFLTHELIFAAEQSAREGRPISLPLQQ
jgi:predicted dehydrogenase